jgi:hypothetical protein
LTSMKWVSSNFLTLVDFLSPEDLPFKQQPLRTCTRWLRCRWSNQIHSFDQWFCVFFLNLRLFPSYLFLSLVFPAFSTCKGGRDGPHQSPIMRIDQVKTLYRWPLLLLMIFVVELTYILPRLASILHWLQNHHTASTGVDRLMLTSRGALMRLT